MEKIVKMNGYVYLVEGREGFETYHNLGKDQDYWEKIEAKKKKRQKKETKTD